MFKCSEQLLFSCLSSTVSICNYPNVGTGKEGNLCEIFYYLVDFFHGLMDMGVVDFMNKNKKKSAKA